MTLRRDPAGHGTRHPLALIDPEILGGPIDGLIRHDPIELESFEPSRPFAEADLDRIRWHRILPLVRSEWVAARLRQSFRTEQRGVAATQLKIEAAMIEALTLLESEKIDTRILKGLATGSLDYPMLGMRQTGDVDLLVRPADLQAAVRILTRHGFQSTHAPKGDLKSIVLRAESGVELDLHLRLARDHRLVDPLWELPPVHFGSDPARKALPLEARFIHAAGHLWWTPYGQRRLSGVADVQVLGRQLNPLEALPLAQSLGLARSCWFGVDLVARLMGMDSPSWPRPSFLETVAFGRPRRHPNVERLLTLRAAPDNRTRVEIMRSAGADRASVLAAGPRRRG